jgi:hypothetical protein
MTAGVSAVGVLHWSRQLIRGTDGISTSEARHAEDWRPLEQPAAGFGHADIVLRPTGHLKIRTRGWMPWMRDEPGTYARPAGHLTGHWSAATRRPGTPPERPGRPTGAASAIPRASWRVPDPEVCARPACRRPVPCEDTAPRGDGRQIAESGRDPSHNRIWVQFC